MGTSIGMVSARSMEGELALLELQSEDSQRKADDASLAAAQARRQAADDQQVAAMRSKASDQRENAWLSGGLQMAAGAVQIGGAAAQFGADENELERTSLSRTANDGSLDAATKSDAMARSDALGGSQAKDHFLAKSLDGGATAMNGASKATDLAFEGKASDHDADATQAKQGSDVQQGKIDDAKKRIDRGQSDFDQKLTMVEKLIDTDAAARSAILQRA